MAFVHRILVVGDDVSVVGISGFESFTAVLAEERLNEKTKIIYE